MYVWDRLEQEDTREVGMAHVYGNATELWMFEKT
jgi:hypothetical protein